MTTLPSRTIQSFLINKNIYRKCSTMIIKNTLPNDSTGLLWWQEKRRDSSLTVISLVQEHGFYDMLYHCPVSDLSKNW